MEDWRLVCLLAVLAALLPVEAVEATGGRRRGVVPNHGDTVHQRENGRTKRVPFADLAAASVAAC